MQAALRLTNHSGIDISGLYLKQFSAGTEQTIMCWTSAPQPRYIIVIHDTSSKSLAGKKTLAVFVTPQGQERGWTFATLDGREQLLRMVKCSRLLVVHLCHAHTFQSLPAVQEELASTAIALKPVEYPEGQITFYTNGDIGQRSILLQREHYLVEEVKDGGKVTRQLLFITNPNDVQSEIRLLADGGYDYGYLPFECQRFVVAGLSLLPKLRGEGQMKVCVLGTGAGVLSSFLAVHFPNFSLTAIDIDPAVPNIGKEFFGLRESPNLHLRTCDGIDYITELSQTAEELDFLIIDINGAGPEDSCPPQGFKTFRFMQMVRDVLAEDALFVVNSAVKGSARRSELVEALKDCFSFIYSGKCEEEANEVFFVIKSQSKYIPKAHSQLRLEMINIEEAHHWSADMDLPEAADRISLQYPLVEETVPPTPEATSRRRKNKRRR